MEERTVSPPKTQRAALQPLTLSAMNNGHTKNRNSITKKLKIEQENYDSSNIPFYLRTSKYNSYDSKPNNFNSIISSLSGIRVPQKELGSLPYEVHLEILKFISPEDLIKKVQYINKHWNKAANDPMLWQTLNENQKLCVDIKFLKQSCIVERRSRGKLYKAVSRLNRQPVAVRMINLSVSNGGSDDGVPTSILREISYMRNLEHVNVSKILEVEVTKEIVQICSEYSDYNLKEYMRQFVSKRDHMRRIAPRNLLTNNPDYKMPLKTIKSLAYQLLKGLSYLHHQGIIHRNLKCDNTLVNGKGIVKISDFALSKFVTVPHAPYTPEDPKDRERSGREARRLWYRAPELLFRKKRYSFETDIWAFGCLLAEIALNEPLFNGDTEIEQLFRIFSMIGSPNTSSWTTICDDDQYKLSFPRWETVYFPYICESPDSAKFKKLYNTLMPNREKVFHKLQALGNVLGPSGLDLLWNCLSLNPQLRTSANNLLHHNFFDDLQTAEHAILYKGVSECEDELCRHAMCYNVPESPDCHLISYFKALRKNEAELRPTPKYLEQQTALTEHMRCILIDWLIDVSVHFDFLDETLHLSVNYIDRTLSKIKLDKTKLQLVGVTCLKIADVFHERSKEYYKQDNAKEYAYITADEYNPQQLIDMEKEVLNLLDFKLISPNTMHFLKIYLALFKIPEGVSVIAMFLADMLLLSHQILEFEYSLIASSVLFLACAAAEFKIDEEILSENKRNFNIYDQEQLRKCVGTIKDLWHAILNTTMYANFDAIYSKYQNRHSFPAKTINPPTYTLEDIKNWFY